MNGVLAGGVLASAVELARWQFALTTLFHFVFVPLTLGLAPFLVLFQTLGMCWPCSGSASPSAT